MSARFELKDRSDQQLLIGAKQLVSRERLATAELIAHLGEIDARRLFLEEGCSSLFKYCTQVLHLSEAATYNRIDVVRIARKFPIIFERLAEGSVHLSAVRILAPCLTPANHLAVLEAAKHKTKEEVEQIAATVRPKPDVPSVIRKLPEGRSEPDLGAGESGLFQGNSVETAAGADPVFVEPEASAAPLVQAPSRRPTVAALSPGRYKVEFTADAETHRALRQLQELMRHQVPNGDVGVIMKEALFLLLEKVNRGKIAQVKQPRKRKAEVSDLWCEQEAKRSEADPRTNDDPSKGNARPAGEPRKGDCGRESRHIPAEVKRSVWERDQGQCAFVGRNGRRCTERGRLEFHHVHAYALGGPATIDNIALFCRAHNAHESRRLFGETNGKKVSRSGASSSS